ncbi:MAG: glycoside hydrolase family 26 protein [Tannerellaceae bacterium]|nr:glycoside hydrolase family 26 protein [Tannerellaceae bacterium]
MKKILFFFMLLYVCACSPGGSVPETPDLPVDRKATRQTQALYNQLKRSLQQGIMVGHQDALAYGHGWYGMPGRSDVKEVAGDYPAVIGWELGHLELGADFNLDSIFFSDMKRYIRETYRRGGITTVSWHGDNIVTGNTAWDCAQDTVVRSILPGGSNHATYKVWLDRLAGFFLDLKDDQGEHIPIVFRMYHEHTGDWFWWCSRQCTPDEYKQLWIMTLTYLRDHKNVHNLLYAYSPSDTQSEVHFLERYPGDEYVDILGFDTYLMSKDAVAIENYQEILDTNLQIITNYAEKAGKIPVIGETGMESIPYPSYFTEVVYPVISRYPIAWVLFWRNAWEPALSDHYYIPFEGHPAATDFRQFVAQPDILLNADINSLF